MSVTGIISNSNSNAVASALMDALNWTYDKVTSSINNPPRTDREINRRIAFYCTTAGATGFATNLGGIITLPVAVPANLFSVSALQLRLIAEIAAGRGYAVSDTEVRCAAVACLVGNGATEIIKEAGVQLANKLTQQAVNQIAGSTLKQINQTVGFRLITKAGSQGLVNLSKAVPIAGGVIGGSVDAFSTRTVGKIAKKVFVQQQLSHPAGQDSGFVPGLVQVPPVPSFFRPKAT